jgi:hypothetical protein
MRRLDLAGAPGIDKVVRSIGTRQQDTAFLESFADCRDPETQTSCVEPLAAGIQHRIGDDLLIALVYTAAGKHQRARIKIDLIMAHHHEDFDFVARDRAIAQQQDRGCGTRRDGLSHASIPPR